MLMTLLALLTAAFSMYFVFTGLRGIATDTAQTVAMAAQRARASGHMPARAAFVLLWGMIFLLSYL